MAAFLPTLRRKSTAPAALQTTALAPAAESKQVLLSGYYAQIGGVTGQPGRPWEVDRAVREGYARVVWVYKSVEAISGNQARLPVQILDRQDPLDDHPLLRLLNGRANPVETGRRFRKRLSQQILLSSRGAFIEVVSSRAGTPTRVDLLPPGRTRIIPARDGSIDHYEVMPVTGMGKPRTLRPDQVRWVGEPHPTDAYACMTPLEAAGLTVELDHFARLFNRSFMANDGRPGGIVGLKNADEDMDDKEMDRVERKFGGGPLDAGRLVVLASGLDYVDVAKTPRDGQWHEAMDRGKDEILVAFGVPESQIGHAANSRYLNAAVEAVSFWQITMLPHNDLVLSSFTDDVEAGLTLAYDVSSVDALHLSEQKRRAELREEFGQGLVSRDYYAEETGRPPLDVPGSKALWLPAGKVPVLQDRADQVAAEKLAPVGSGTQAAPMRGGAVGGGQGPGQGGGNTISAAMNNNPYNVDSVQKFAQEYAGHPAGVGREMKSGRRQRRPQAGDDEEDERVRTAAEDELAAELTALAARAVEQAVGRVQGVKARRGTRHWTPAGTKALDVGSTVDPAEWGAEAGTAAQGVLDPYAAGYAERLQDYLAQDGVDTTQPDDTAQQQPAQQQQQPPVVMPPPGADGLRHPLIDAAVLAGAAAVTEAVEARVERLRDRVRDADAAGASMPDIVAALRGTHAERVAPAGSGDVLALLRGLGSAAEWARAVAATATTTALEGARDAVLRAAGDRVERTWRTRRDPKVRVWHQPAEGQVVTGNKRFTLGNGEEARYPGDPDLSPGNRINCRCRLGYTVRLAGRSLSLGAGEVETKDFDPAKHPRGYRGRFMSLVEGERVVSPPGARATVTLVPYRGEHNARLRDTMHGRRLRDLTREDLAHLARLVEMAVTGEMRGVSA